MDQPGEFGLSVPVPVPPVFKSLLAGRLRPDEAVADWGMPAVAFDCVEESRVRILAYCDLFVFDDGGKWFRCHGCLLPFVRCRGVEDLLYEFLSFLGELPSPAWPVVSACAVSVDAVDVSRPFEFDHAAS